MLKGHVFQKQIFENHMFALFMNTFLAGHNGIINGYKNSMQITYNESKITVNSGALCVQGRFLEEDSSTTLEAGTNTLYNILVLTINLDRENNDSSFQQGYYEILSGSNNYPTLTQNDIINTNSGKYQYELARFKTSLNGITDFIDKRTYLDFDSIYKKLEEQTDIVFKNELTETLEEYITNTSLSNILKNYITNNFLSNALKDYLKKQGDALIGYLIINSDNNSETGLRISNSLRNILLNIHTNGYIGIWDSTNNMYLINWTNEKNPNCNIKGNIIPINETFQQNLGNSSKRWKNVFIDTLEFGDSAHGYGKVQAGANDCMVLMGEGGYTVRAYSDYNIYKPLSASAFNVESSRRYKENIQDITEQRANKILDVNVVTYDYKNKENGVDRVGVIAEDVVKIIPEVVTYKKINDTQLPDSVDYSKFIPYIIKKIQMQEERISQLELMVEKLKGKSGE